MTITTTQKIIKIGTSKGMTLPAKELKRLGVDVGDEVEIVVRKKAVTTQDSDVIQAAQSILERYNQDFTNLAQR
jgi:antitoxin component of MazEF toxin-antitoxin module